MRERERKREKERQTDRHKLLGKKMSRKVRIVWRLISFNRHFWFSFTPLPESPLGPCFPEPRPEGWLLRCNNNLPHGRG